MYYGWAIPLTKSILACHQGGPMAWNHLHKANFRRYVNYQLQTPQPIPNVSKYSMAKLIDYHLDMVCIHQLMINHNCYDTPEFSVQLHKISKIYWKNKQHISPPGS